MITSSVSKEDSKNDKSAGHDVADKSKPNESSSTKKPDPVSKKCPLCTEVFQADDKRQLSVKVADHIEAKHPEPVETVNDKLEKKTFSAQCQYCERIVESDTEEKLESLMQTHSLSHKNEEKLEKKESKTPVLAILAISLLLVGGIIGLSVLLSSKKKNFKKTEGK